MSKHDQLAREQIVVSGVEGGGVTLYGERTPEGWRFMAEFVDQTPMMLADDENQTEIRNLKPVTESWEEALKNLDQMDWLKFPARMVHKEFRQRIWDAVRARLGGDERNANRLERWRERCGIDL